MHKNFFATWSWWAYVLLVTAVIVLLLLGAMLVVELVVYAQGLSEVKFFTPADHATTSTAIAALIAGITTVSAVAVAVIAGYYAKGQYETAKGQLVATNAQLAAAKDQLLIGQRTAYGDFLLRLDEAFRKHQNVHIKLRPGGEWSRVGPDGKLREKVDGPKFPEDGPAVEGYMGLFERVQILLEKDLIDDIDVVYRLYGYRLFNIVDNPNIYQNKLVKFAGGWRDFIQLWLDLQKHRDKTRSTEETRHRQVNEALIAAHQIENPTIDRRQDGRRDDSTANALIALLTHSNSDARAFAARELALVRDQDLRARASKALINAMRDENLEVRLWADRTLQFYDQPLPDDA